MSAQAKPFSECNEQPAYQLRLKFYDQKAKNEELGREWPIREEQMYVKISLARLYGFNIFPTDNVAISFYRTANP